jgi:hypothetical protein
MVGRANGSESTTSRLDLTFFSSLVLTRITMQADDKNQPDQNEKQPNKPLREMGFDVHPIKAEPLSPFPTPILNPRPATGPSVSAGSLPFNQREQIFIFLVVLLVVALVGVSMIYAWNYPFDR